MNCATVRGSRHQAWLGALLLAALMAAPVEAQVSQSIPPVEDVVLPDLSSTNDPAVADEGWKYFFFHKQGTTYADAYADFAECYHFLPGAGVKIPYFLPMFVPWGEKTTAAVKPVTGGQYGLVGIAIMAMVPDPAERRSRQSRLRRCLEPRGYVRYPLSKDSWEELVDDYSFRSIAMQAKAATGPHPSSAPVTK